MIAAFNARRNLLDYPSLFQRIGCIARWFVLERSSIVSFGSQAGRSQADDFGNYALRHRYWLKSEPPSYKLFPVCSRVTCRLSSNGSQLGKNWQVERKEGAKFQAYHSKQLHY